MLGVREDDRVYQGFSVAFDMSFEEIWISYLVGATLWIAPPSVQRDPELLAESLTRHRITVLHAVPTLMGLVDDSAADGAAHQSGRRGVSRGAGGTPGAAGAAPVQHLRTDRGGRLRDARRSCSRAGR